MRKVLKHLMAVILLAAVLLIPSLCVRTVYAEPDTASVNALGDDTPAVLGFGSCGQNAWWMVFEAGGTQTLHIGGSGATDQVSMFSVPWAQYKYTVEQLSVGEGITALGEYAFNGFILLKNAALPHSLTAVGDYAFNGCSSLKDLTVPNSVKTLGTNALATGNRILFTGSNLEWEERGGAQSLGTSTVSFSYIYAYQLAEKGELQLSNTSYTYNDREFEPDVTVTYGTQRLIKDKDYTVSYKNNKEAGTAKVTVKGRGAYEGTLTGTFEIKGCPMQDAVIYGLENRTYTGAKQTQSPRVEMRLNGKTYLLKKDRDYTISYKDNVKAGTATVVVKGTGNFSGSKNRTFTIWAAYLSLSDAKVTGIEDKVYTGAARGQQPVVKVKLNGKTVTLKKNVDYKIEYKNNTNSGLASVYIRGKGNFQGSVYESFRINKRSLAKAMVTGIKNKTYTGKAVTQNPVVKLKIGSKTVTLKKGQDYSLSYKNNLNAGTATVTIWGEGNYKGTIKKTFKITAGTGSASFAQKKVTASRIGSTFTNKLTTASDGKKTFKSSNARVASVDKSSGKVTIKGVGKATITVNIAASKKFKALTAKYTVVVNRELSWTNLRFSFSNSFYGFGYSSGYRIPYSRYKLVFGSDAQRIYNLKAGDWGGSCFGMSSTSGLMNNSGSGVKASQFKSSADRPGDLRIGNKSSRYDLTLREYIEAMQISQYSSKFYDIWWHTLDKLDTIVQQVKEGAAKSEPVIICFYNDRIGHAVLGYDVEKVDSEKTRIWIYDPNFPDEKRSITFYTKNGNYTGWYYNCNDSIPVGSAYRDCGIYSIPYSTYSTLWSGNNKPANAIVTNSAAFEILDGDGNRVAEMKDGVLESTDERIRRFVSLDTENSGTMICLPEQDYRFVNLQQDLEMLELRTLDSVLSVSAEAEGVTAWIGADAVIGTVNMSAAASTDYSVTLESLNLQKDGIEQLCFAGTGSGTAALFGVEDGQYVFESSDPLTVSINGEVVEEFVPGSSGDNNQDEPEPAGP